MGGEGKGGLEDWDLGGEIEGGREDWEGKVREDGSIGRGR